MINSVDSQYDAPPTFAPRRVIFSASGSTSFQATAEQQLLKMAGITNFASLRVDELKKILNDRGIPCAGKTKEELMGLVEKGWCRYEVKEGCDHEESERKRRRVVGDDGYVIDLNGRSVEWTTSLKDCPSLSLSAMFLLTLSSHVNGHRKGLPNSRMTMGI